jgi:hypothetical protein
MKTAQLTSIKKNILGTLDINLKVKGMRKEQSFSVYPINKDTKQITIQSDKRIAIIDLNGKGKMSKNHQNGAYFHHLQIDVLTPFEFSSNDWDNIKKQIGLTANKNAGKKENGVISSDNSSAKSIFNL